MSTTEPMTIWEGPTRRFAEMIEAERECFALRAREQRLKAVKAALEPLVKFAEGSKAVALSCQYFEEAARIEGIIKTARAALNEGEGKVTL